MKQYEFVTVIDTNLNAKQIEECRDSALTLLEKAGADIKERDEIGLLPLAYPLNGNMQAYVASYLIDLDPTHLSELKSDLRLIKGLAKSFFYSFGANDKFMKFAELKKQFEVVVEEEAEREEAAAEAEENAKSAATEDGLEAVKKAKKDDAEATTND